MREKEKERERKGGMKESNSCVAKVHDPEFGNNSVREGWAPASLENIRQG